jgi:hypothetical protein
MNYDKEELFPLSGCRCAGLGMFTQTAAGKYYSQERCGIGRQRILIL